MSQLQQQTSGINTRKVHKIIGLVLIFPMFAWALTGLIFFIKPGYQAAYGQLKVKTYPLAKSFVLPANKTWQEVKLVKTILGEHLLVKSAIQSEHLHAGTLTTFIPPSAAEYRLLVEDAVSDNKERYGDIIRIDNLTAFTSTGVDITLDWKNLTLRQTGQDTKLINLIYKIHYLQWTPIEWVNQVLGMVGLLLIIALTVLGIRVYLMNKQKS